MTSPPASVPPSRETSSPPIALAVHGGAGAISREKLTAPREAAYHTALRQALEAGHTVLLARGAAVDAVTEAVAALEDCPLFNAGKGSVLTRDGTVEMDAAIMDGQDRAAGAVTLISKIEHPVRLARTVMRHSSHVLLGGAGAEAFAIEHGFERKDPSFFLTKRRQRQLEQLRAGRPQASVVSEDLTGAPDSPPVQEGSPSSLPNRSSSPPTPDDDHEFGTVGAVALDASGNLAAATSTGGLMNKLPGRVGDSPILGAGTYADNRAAAVSTTGHGESFLRIVAAHDVCARMIYQGLSLRRAADLVIHEELARVGGKGGLIAVDRRGTIVFSLSTKGMYRGSIDPQGRLHTAIF